MASDKKKKNEDDSQTPGVKKRPQEVFREKKDDSKSEDGVVRAPEAPTTAPNAPKPKPDKDSAEKSGGGRRVVDAKKAAKEAKEKKEAAKKKAREEKKKKEQARRARAQKEADEMGFDFGDEDATMDDFAAMFEGESSAAMPDTGRLQVGDTVDGEIVSVGKRYIFADIGRADEAIIDRSQYVDEDGNLELEVGDRSTFYVIGFDGGVNLGRELGAGDNTMRAVETAHASGVPISGTVTGTNKGGFEVNIAGVDAFCPISQIELGYTEEPDIHIGKTYKFQVSEIKDDGRSVVVSRAALLEEERKVEREATLANVDVGDEVEGVVTRVADFGAFVDIGGVEGLVHISELSHIFFDNPSEVVEVGDNVTVQIMSIEEEEDRDKGSPLRIGLSIKEAQQDPWLEVNEKFAIGETIQGTITRIAPFGAFIEMMPGVDGLVHVSEISRTEHVSTPDEFVEVGQVVQVEIQDIDVMRKRISLSMAAAQDDPWKEVTQRFATAMEVEGVVANTEDFGVFVDLGKGITALLPRSEMNLPSEVTPHRKYSKGQEITARILNIEPERRRIALTTKEADQIGADTSKNKSSGDSGGPRSYTDDTGTDKKETLGTLGDLLQAKKDED